MKKKTTVYLEEALLRAAKIEAATSQSKEYEVFEAAIRDYIGWKVVERVRGRAGLNADEATEIAQSELAAMRIERKRETPGPKR